MKILIVGAGVVGYHLAEELSTGKHDITVIDHNLEVINNITSHLDVMAINGDGTLISVLKKAGIDTAEMIVAVTSSDESNIMICHLASKFSVRKKVARVLKEEWFKSGLVKKSEFSIDEVINPTELIIDHIQKIIATPGLVDVAEFSDPSLAMLAFYVSEETPILGKKVVQLRENFSFDDFILSSIYRDHRMVIPTGSDTIRNGDICYILTNKDMITFVLPFFNRSMEKVNSVVISGGGNLGFLIAKNLGKTIPKVFLIEPNKSKAEELADLLTNTAVICGDATDPYVLEEANITKTDFFISAEKEPKSNLLTSLFAKARGAKKVITITDETDYLPVIDTIGLNVVINPRLMIAGEILRYIRRGRIHSVVKLKTGGIEILEQVTTHRSKAVNRPIEKLNFPRGALIAAVVEDGNPIFPNGKTVLKPNQEIILISKSDVVEQVSNFFL